MLGFNVVCGLPRSGSTLLCNILNQNPRFFASSTSSLPNAIASVCNSWSNSIEVKNLLEKQKEFTEERMNNSLRAFIENWYSMDNINVVFDKSRGWNLHHLTLKKLYPKAKIICMVRDLRNVFASIEKQYLKNPLLDDSQNPSEKTIYNRADNMFSPEGMLGNCLTGISDLIRRNIDVIFIKYETFVEKPKETMNTIYREICEDYFEHDFNNVVNTAIDCDGHYLNKFPHNGEGKVSLTDKKEYKKYLSEDLSNLIFDKYVDFNNYFQYNK